MLISPDALATDPLLTADEEIALARQMEAGALAGEVRRTGRLFRDATDEELVELEELGGRARQRYIGANLKLVAQAARQAATRSRLPESDLFQEGCLGLICAVERFDWRRGYRFSTYASYWIRAYVSAATASGLGALNVPVSRAGQLRLARGIEVELAQSLGRSASAGEVAVALGRSERWTADLLAHQAPQSLEGLPPGALDQLGAAAMPDAGAEHDERWGAELLWHLEGQQREVLALRFGFVDGTVHTYMDIGHRLSITASKARRLELQAVELLRGVCPSDAALQLEA
jgi:RNA polymerase sigma factor (sigma-70 family)